MKKMWMGKWVAVLALSAGLLAGCSGNGNGTNGGASSPAASGEPSPAAEDVEEVKGDTPITFSFYGNYDWFTMGAWGEDPITKWMQENKNVTVTAVQSSGAADAKFNTMIASDSLADVIMLDRGANVERLRQGGRIVALDDYLAKYPNLLQNAGEETLNMLRSEDGKLYQFPNWYTSSPNGNGGWIVNKKIYKELGSPKLETFDDLYAYLKLVKENYPNVTPLEVGIAAQGIEVMYSGYSENKPYLQKANPVGDELTSIFVDPIFRENLQYVSKLFRERLITQDAFTQSNDQVVEKLNSGRVAVFVNGDVVNPGRTANQALQDLDPEAGYDIVWPIHKAGLDGGKITPNDYNSLGWNVLVITKNAADPERIFAFLDWLTGEEGQRIVNFGPPGLYWDEFNADGVPLLNENGLTAPQSEKDSNKLGVYNWVGNTTFIDATKAKLDEQLPEEQRNWTTSAQQAVTWKTSSNFTQFVNLDPLPDSDEGTIAAMVNDIYTESFAKAVYASSDEEVLSILDRAQADAEKAGYTRLLQYKTERWQDNLRKMSGQ